MGVQTSGLSDMGPCMGKTLSVKAKLSFGWVKVAYLFIQKCCLETEWGDSSNSLLQRSGEEEKASTQGSGCTNKTVDGLCISSPAERVEGGSYRSF